MRTARDLTGMVFGKWTVVGRSLKKSKNVTYWDCRCECGYTGRRATGQLTRGKTKKCQQCNLASRRALDLTGKRFGFLTVKQRHRVSPTNQQTRVLWLCVCDCGEECMRSGTRLMNPYVTTGCKRCCVRRQILFGFPVSTSNLSRLVGRSFRNVRRHLYNGKTPEQILRSTSRRNAT